MIQRILSILKQNLNAYAMVPLLDMQRQDVYKWLQTTDPSTLHHRACKQYEPATGDWILRSDEWKAWLEGNTRSVWIHGIPGAGKTILASHLIEVLKKYSEVPPTQKFASVYYYCYFGHDQDEASPFLKWTLSRLCREAQVVPPFLYNLYMHGGEPSLADLLHALEEIVGNFDRIHIVIDAVDESMPRHNLLGILRDLAIDVKFRNVHILATSRQYTDIEEAMSTISAIVSMRNPMLDEDIRLFVQAQLRTHPKLKHWPLHLKNEVLEALSTKAEGM